VTYSDTLVAWHDFYVAAGTISATLVGLLFVGISLHVKVVAAHNDVRRLARVTLSTFFTVAVISLVALIPTDRPDNSGVAFVAIGLVALTTIIPALEVLGARGRRTLPRYVLFSRFGIVLATALGLIAVGIGLIGADFHDALAGLVGIVLLMLVVSVRNTWDLLVTLASK